MPRYLLGAAVAVVALGLAGCSTTSPDVIGRGDAQSLSTVVDAVVLNVRSVTVEGTQSGIGAGTGAIVGGVAGSSVGGRREGLIVGAVGAVVGSVVGNTVERAATRENAVELLLQLPNGERRVVVQALGEERLEPGDAVLVISSGGRVRVTRAPTAPARRSGG